MSRTAELVCVVLTLPTICTLRLVAQHAPVSPGTRVRIVAPSVARDQLVGTIRATGKDTLVLDVADRASPFALPFARVETLEVSRGRHSHTLQGLGVGFLIGAVVGAAAGSSCEGDWVCPGPAGGALVLGVVAAVPGAVIGALARSERWESVPLDRMSVTGGPSGLALALSLRF